MMATSGRIPSSDRQPGQLSDRLIVASTLSDFELYYDEFIDSLRVAKLNVVGFNMKWDYSLSTGKQRAKNAAYLAKKRSAAVGRGFRSANRYGNKDSDSEPEDEDVRQVRETKANLGRIAIVSMSNLCGFTLQVRTCMMGCFPERLKQFIETSDYWKVGFGLRRDMYKLWEEERVQLLNWVDIRNLLIQWPHFRQNYHFCRMGTHSVASYLFGVEFVNNNLLSGFNAWYAKNLNPDMSRGLAHQTQLDVDLYAQFLIKFFGPEISSNDTAELTFLSFDWFAQCKVKMEAFLLPYRNIQYEKSAYNFAFAPSMVRKVLDAQCQQLGPNFKPMIWLGERGRMLRRRFGAQPFGAISVDIFDGMKVGDKTSLFGPDPETGRMRELEITLVEDGDEDDAEEQAQL